jgi:hypothetical protein
MSSTPIQVYDARVRGLWDRRHTISSEGETLGELSIQRRWWGMVAHGEFRPIRGEVLTFRRDPGLLRSQFSLWTDGREWLGSSLRWSNLAREVHISSGNKPFRLLPVEGLSFGWSLYAPKTGESARIFTSPFSGRSRLEVYRRLDFPLLLFAYFLGTQILFESLLPGPAPEKVKSGAAATAV